MIDAKHITPQHNQYEIYQEIKSTLGEYPQKLAKIFVNAAAETAIARLRGEIDRDVFLGGVIYSDSNPGQIDGMVSPSVVMIAEKLLDKIKDNSEPISFDKSKRRFPYTDLEGNKYFLGENGDPLALHIVGLAKSGHSHLTLKNSNKDIVYTLQSLEDSDFIELIVSASNMLSQLI